MSDTKPKGDYGAASDAGYADPGHQSDKKPRYPLKDGGKLSEERIRAAWSYINKSKNASAYSSEELEAIKGKIKSAAAKVGIEISDEADDGKRAEGTDEARADTSATVPVRENLEGKPNQTSNPPDGMMICRACMGSGYVVKAPDEKENAPSAQHAARSTQHAAELEPDLTRIEEMSLPELRAACCALRAAFNRAETAEADLVRVQGALSDRESELAQARERVDVLERMPATANPPVRFPRAFDREFLINRANGREAEALELDVELKELSGQRPTSPEEQNRVAARINAVKAQISALL